jgi:hypothetical protein
MVCSRHTLTGEHSHSCRYSLRRHRIYNIKRQNLTSFNDCTYPRPLRTCLCHWCVRVYTAVSGSPTTQPDRVTSLQSVRCVEEVTCSLQPLCSRCLGCAWSGLPTNYAYTSHVLEMWEVKKNSKNVASYSETRHVWNINEGASSACYSESVWLDDYGSFSHYEASLSLSDQPTTQQLVIQSIYPSVLVS